MRPVLHYPVIPPPLHYVHTLNTQSINELDDSNSNNGNTNDIIYTAPFRSLSQPNQSLQNDNDNTTTANINNNTTVDDEQIHNNIATTNNNKRKLTTSSSIPNNKLITLRVQHINGSQTYVQVTPDTSISTLAQQLDIIPGSSTTMIYGTKQLDPTRNKVVSDYSMLNNGTITLSQRQLGMTQYIITLHELLHVIVVYIIIVY